MTVGLGEALADAVNTYLAANLPAKLNALDAEFADSIVLDDPVAYYVGEKTLENVPGYPAIFTIVPDITIGRWTPDYIDATYQVIIGVLLLDTDTEVLRRKLYRLLRAMTEVLIASQINGALGWYMLSSQGGGEFRLSFSPIYSQNEVFLSDAQISVQIKRRTLETL